MDCQKRKQRRKHIQFKKSISDVYTLFLLAAVVTTVFSLPATITDPIKELSKFFIVMAMAAIGMNTNIVKLVKTGGKRYLWDFAAGLQYQR